jgi:hypothetical protein
MTHDELIEKAVERLRKVEGLFERSDKVPSEMRRLKADEMHKRTIREAVFIRFEADDNRGSIELVMDRETGVMLANKFIPPLKKTDDRGATPSPDR